MIQFIRYYLFISLFLLYSITGLAVSASPVDMLQQTTNQMLVSLQKTENRNAKSLYNLVQTILLPHVDLNRMSQLVIGKYWVDATPAQREQFKQQFTYFVTRTYSTALSSYTNEKVRFMPVRGNSNGDRVQVNSVIEQSNGQNVSVNYRLLLTNGQWKVYDFIVEGVSMVENYRSQFSNILRTEGMDGLLKNLKSHNSKTQ